MNPVKLCILKDKQAFAQAASVVEWFLLDDLMEVCCPYNVPLVLQFMSTLVIGTDTPKTMKWMSGTHYCESTFKRFARVLGYKYQGHPPIGYRMHEERTNRDQLMEDMYYPTGIPGKIEGLLPFYG